MFLFALLANSRFVFLWLDLRHKFCSLLPEFRIFISWSILKASNFNEIDILFVTKRRKTRRRENRFEMSRAIKLCNKPRALCWVVFKNLSHKWTRSRAVNLSFFMSQSFCSFVINCCFQNYVVTPLITLDGVNTLLISTGKRQKFLFRSDKILIMCLVNTFLQLVFQLYVN